MAFVASKSEWAELCTFFQLLNEGKVALGNAEGKPSGKAWPIAMVQRVEHDGVRCYYIEENEIHVKGEGIDRRFMREDFTYAAEKLVEVLKTPGTEVESPEGMEGFLDEIGIYNLEAQTDDRTDMYLAFFSADAPLVGMRIYSKMPGMHSLLDGGRAANIKFEQVGIRFPSPTVNKINQFETNNVVLDRISLIERLGGQLKFNDAADKIFRSNLHMIDLHFPRMVGEMARTMYLEDVSKVSELVERIKEQNPLKIKDELIRKHGYYEYKMKEFLLALANGLRPAKLYNGTESQIDGMLLLDGDGNVLCYNKANRQAYADFLYYNSRLEKGDMIKDKYGVLERENGLFYFKLNLKIGLKVKN